MARKSFRIMVVAALLASRAGGDELTGPQLIQPANGEHHEQEPVHEQESISVQSLVQHAYEKAKRAESTADCDAVLSVCRQLRRADLAPKATAYVDQLAAWTFNKRGEILTTRAAEEESLEQGEQARDLDAAALENFEAAVRLDAHCWRAWHNRGISYAKAGRAADALRDFDAAIRIHPQYANAWFNRAEVHSQLGHHQKAIEDYGESLRLEPDDVDAYVGRAHASYQLKRYDTALADLDRALQLDPRCALALVDRAELHAVQLRWEQAAADYRSAMQVAPEYGRALHGAAWLMATCPQARYRNPELALQTVRKAIELDGTANYRYLETLAAAQAAAGQFDQARVSQAAAIEAAPEEVAESAKLRLALYEQETPYRESRSKELSTLFR